MVLYGLWVAWTPLLPRNLYVPLLDLGKITGYTWPSALKYLGLVLGLNALYAIGYSIVARGRAGARFVFVFAGICCFELLWVYPATAVDVFAYAAHGRLLAWHGLNPLIAPPNTVPDDALLPYLAFPAEPSQYGPVWVLLNGALARLAKGNLEVEILLYKVLGSLAHLAGGAVILAIAARLGAGNARALASAYLFLCNPLLLWEMVGNAHNDGLMMLGGLGAAWLLTSRADRWVLPAVALGALVKLPVMVIGLPFGIAIWHRRWRAAIEGVLLALALAVAAYRPFWQGPETLTALRRTDLFTASLGSVVRQALEPPLGEAIAASIGRFGVIAAFGAVCLVVLWHLVRPRHLADILMCAYAVLMALLLLANTWFQAWYVVWPFAFGAALASTRRHLEVALLALGGLLQYFVFIYLWVMGVVQTPMIQYAAYAAVLGPLVLGLAVVRLGARAARPAQASVPAH